MLKMRTILASACVVLFLLVMPAVAQQEKGDKEVAFSAQVLVPHADPATTTAVLMPRLGYYFTDKDIVGVTSLVMVNQYSKDVYLEGMYRHLFPTSNAKVFPFVGAAGGVNVYTNDDSATNGTARGEFGVKFYLSQSTAFEFSYNLQYIRMAGAGFTDSSYSAVLVGFTYIFGKGKK